MREVVQALLECSQSVAKCKPSLAQFPHDGSSGLTLVVKSVSQENSK